MATSAERMRAPRERERRGLRKFTIGVSEDDLRVIAEHRYGEAASTDQDCRSLALGVSSAKPLPVWTATGDTVT